KRDVQRPFALAGVDVLELIDRQLRKKRASRHQFVQKKATIRMLRVDRFAPAHAPAETDNNDVRPAIIRQLDRGIVRYGPRRGRRRKRHALQEVSAPHLHSIVLLRLVRAVYIAATLLIKTQHRPESLQVNGVAS